MLAFPAYTTYVYTPRPSQSHSSPPGRCCSRGAWRRTCSYTGPLWGHRWCPLECQWCHIYTLHTTIKSDHCSILHSNTSLHQYTAVILTTENNTPYSWSCMLQPLGQSMTCASVPVLQRWWPGVKAQGVYQHFTPQTLGHDHKRQSYWQSWMGVKDVDDK